MSDNLKNVLVVGMPRSGTSLTASLFGKRGYFAADDAKAQLRDGDEHNPLGYWEAESLIEANAELFKRVGFEGHNTWLFDQITPEQAQRINELEGTQEHRELVAGYEERRPWVLKDPRLCYTVGYWWKLVDQSQTVVVLIRRNRDEIFESFFRLGWRDGSAESRADVYQRIDDHLGFAEKTLHALEIPHIVIEYTEYERDPVGLVARIHELTGLSLQVDELEFSKKHNHSGMWAKLQTRSRRMYADLSSRVKRRLPPSVVARVRAALRRA